MNALLVSLAIAAGQPPADDWKTPEAAHLKNITQVTDGFVRAGEGYFSPDGKKLAFVSDIGSNIITIFTMNLDGSDVTQIGLGRYTDWLPAWTRR